jgi:hypothetical protein
VERPLLALRVTLGVALSAALRLSTTATSAAGLHLRPVLLLGGRRVRIVHELELEDMELVPFGVGTLPLGDGFQFLEALA